MTQGINQSLLPVLSKRSYSLVSLILVSLVWFSLVSFYGISTTVGYLMPNPVYSYTLDINDL